MAAVYVHELKPAKRDDIKSWKASVCYPNESFRLQFCLILDTFGLLLLM